MSNYDDKSLCMKISDGATNYVITSSERSIRSEIEKYGFSDEIINQADAIYNLMKKSTHRGKIRQQLKFYCVYCAHIELGIIVNPIHLGEIFELQQGDVQKCDALFSPLQTGYKPRKPTFTSPLDYLPSYCQKLNLSVDAINDLSNLANSIINKDPSLLQESPHTVSAGIFCYYIVTNGVTAEDPQFISRITGRSAPTIDLMCKRIAKIDNQ